MTNKERLILKILSLAIALIWLLIKLLEFF
jgi:hypothetical protein